MTDPTPHRPKRAFSRQRLQEVTRATTITALNRGDGPLRASGAQRVFWYLSQMEKSGAAYVLQSALRITGPVDVQALSDSFDLVARRHEGLRTRFHLNADTLTLDIAAPDTPFAFDTQAVDDPHTLEARMAEAIAAPMDLAHGPLARATLFALSPHDHMLLVTLHHAVADHASFALLWPEICEVYTALSAGAPAPEHPQTLPYADYAAWERAQAETTGLVRDKTYWCQTLADAPALSSPPPDRRRGAAPDYAGAVVAVHLDAAVADALTVFAARASVTPFAVGLAAWALFLQEITGQSDIVTAAPVTQRDRPELARTVGPFVNTLALRFGAAGPARATGPAGAARATGAARADACARAVQHQFLEAREHQALPIDQVIEAVDPPRSPAHNPLYQTMFSWNEGSAPAPIAFGAASARFAPIDGHTAQLDLTLDVVQRAGGITAQFEYATALYDPGTVQCFAERYSKLLTRLITPVEGGFATLDQVRAAEPSVITGAPAPEAGGLIHDRIAAQAQKAPDAVAIVDTDTSVSYGMLDRRANHLAQRLSEAGIGPGARVAICLAKSAACFIAALAVLKTGASYVPIDSDTPAARLAFIVQDSGAAVVILAPDTAHTVADVPVLTYPTAADGELSTASVSGRAVSPADPAYVIYTSGSTEQPKGVVVSHGAIAQMVANWGNLLSLGTPPVVLQMASFAFDVAVADFLRALCFGGRLVLCSKACVMDGAALSARIRAHGVTLADFTPAVIDMLIDSAGNETGLFDTFRHIICGSDLWALSSARRLRQLCPPSCRILHAYGLTETTVDALFFDLDDLTGAETALPLGHPVAGLSVTICDDDLTPVPRGQQGEICLSGPTLADGYLGAPDLTAARFVTQAGGGQQFRTGDLGRIGASGQVEFLGRADAQIKIRGYRIDPGEIETHLRNAGAAAAHVLQRGGQLVAYVTGTTPVGTTAIGHSAIGQTAIAETSIGPAPIVTTTIEDLRRTLALHLPDYLRPSAFVALDRLPLTPNGKIDSAALPDPVFDTQHQPPEGNTEQTLADLWQEMLGGPPVGRSDNFFERGGHSMLAVRMATDAAARLGHPVDGSVIFAQPTLRAFAASLHSDDIARPDIPRPALTRRSRAVQMPASFGQEAMWFLAQDPAQNAAYNMPFGLQLLPQTDPAALRAALHAVVARHEALRAGFATVNGLPVLEIHDRVTLPFETVAITAQQLPEVAAQQAKTPFNLHTAPLVRVCWAQVSDGPDVVFVTLHHIISDGWSIDILGRELAQLHADFAGGNPASLPPLELQFGDYVLWQRDAVDAARLAAQLDFWARTLGTAPALIALPTDRPRPAVQDYRGDRIDLSIDAPVVAALHSLARETSTTVFVVVLAAWHYMLGRVSGDSDIVTGVPTANRTPAQTQQMIGYFVNTLAVRTDHRDTPTPRALVAQLRTVMAQAQAHGDVPFSKVVEHLNPVRTRSHAPVFQTMLAWEEAAQEPSTGPAPFVSYPVAQHHAKYDLLLEIAGSGDAITGSLQFATSLFDAQTATRFCAYFKHVLSAFVAQPDANLSSIGLADHSELVRAQTRWHAPLSPPKPADRILPRLAARAAKAPEAPALRAGGETLSYAALSDLSDRLAHRLQARGLVRDQPVALWADRSVETVIAVIAILKAGGAVLPLDPSHPPARIGFMIKDAAPFALLTSAPVDDLPADLMADKTWSLSCDTLRAMPPPARPFAPPDPAQAAYVLYTSGTTGQPKGVVQTHRMLDNLTSWQLAQPGTPARVLQFASLTFDVAFQEILSALCGGACLVLITADQTRDVAALGRLITDLDIQRAFLPVAVVQVLGGMITTDNTTPKNPGSGCEIITAGEALKLSETLRRALPKLGGAALNNQYGPTETHVVSQYTLPMAAATDWPDLPPIGTAIANTCLYVLDAAQRPVPDGVAGELFIGGYGVARGYLGRADLTAERFLPDPFVAQDDMRMFKSGDLVRRRSDGNIDYIGRADDQVKIRGYRVEPSEIEVSLRAHPGIGSVTVLARSDPAGQRRLVSYFTGTASPQELRRDLLAQMPDYMCPTEWVHLPRLPLNSSGKVDRTALPDPDWQGQRAGERPLEGETQTLLGTIWGATLGVDAVFADDDFFALGGHSLLAARIVFEINQRLGTALRLSDIFAAPVLADLALRIDAAHDNGPDSGHNSAQTAPLPQIVHDPANRFAPFPLSDIQQAYLVGREDQLGLGGVAAHSYTELRINRLDVPRFEAASNRVIDRHDLLRAVFTPDGQQQVLEHTEPYRIAVHDLTGQDQAAQDAALHTIRNAMSHQVLDPAQWPLFAFEVTRLSPQTVHLHISLDALIVDAASTSLLIAEILAHYFDPNLTLPPVGVSFRDYIIAEQALRAAPSYQKALSYWLARFEQIPTGPDLPLLCNPDSLSAPQFTRRDKTLDAERWQSLKGFAAAEKITASGMLLAAFCLVLRRYAQSPDFSLSLPIFNRLPLHPDVGSVIGDFTSVLLFQDSASATGSFASYARSVQQALWRDMDHAQVSGIEIMRALGRKHGQQAAGLPVVFNSTLTEMAQSAPLRQPRDRLDAQAVHTITQTPQVWIDHTIIEEDGALVFNWDSIDALFAPGLMDAMFADYLRLLEALGQQDAWSADAGGLLAADPVAPATPQGLPTLHGLFLDQATRTPTHPAILSTRRSLDYATVRAEAQTLAADLQQAGCTAGAIVALLLPPGWEQTVGVLASLIAGGAYLPLDPDLPRERLQKILTRTGARHVLVQSGFAGDDLLPEGMTVLPICADPTPKKPIPVASGPDTLAYVIFTSGSTGDPKGVMIDHGGAANTILDINARIGLGAQDRILAVSALNFDLSVYDIFGPLSVGGTVVVPDADKHRDPAHWAALMRNHQVTVWNAVPALTGLLAEYLSGADAPEQARDTLRVAMMSGDWIPLDLPGKLRTLAPDITVWSLGGATEASIWSIGHLVGDVAPDWTSIPYGQALSGQSVHVLDDTMGERPDMIGGDLYIGGRGLALGYWDDPARTEAAFVTHPRTGMRLYKTGDLGRRRPDGTIVFLGRADSQVKVQGYRIELGEIEAALERHPQVTACAVRVWGDAMQTKRLAGYVVAATPAPTETDLRDHLAAILPAYEIPSSFTVLPGLPLSANGKVDRKQLPEPTAQTAATDQIDVQPGAEQDLLRIVCQTLKQDDIATDANLLSLGASSLDIVRICNAAAADLGFRPPLAKFMRAPSVATLIGLWRAAAPQAQTETPEPEQIETLQDDAARAAFKAAEKGRRRFGAEARRIRLSHTSANGTTPDRFEANRSTRRFVPAPIPTPQFSELLSCLMQNQSPDRPRFQFASAGGLYPVQTYLSVKPNRIAGIPAGCYYLDPKGQHLVQVGDGTHLTAEAYDYFVNRPTFDSAAFAVFLILDRAATEPVYGPRARDMALIEAGQIAQHLTNRAGEIGLGLCGIGDLEATALTRLFGLGPHHGLLYSMLGGIPYAGGPTPGPTTESEEFEI